MTFVYEKISDEDKRRIDFSKIKAWGHAVKPHRWVIDREQDAFFLFAHPEREPPYARWYAFWWKEQVFSVAVVEGQSLSRDDGLLIVPVQINVFMPHGVSASSPQIDAAVIKIKEAVEAEIRGSATDAGWGYKIAEVQIKVK